MTESPVIDIVVREANANDFDFVADLMIRALTPFYDGDHHAHARRILETHMNGVVSTMSATSRLDSTCSSPSKPCAKKSD